MTSLLQEILNRPLPSLAIIGNLVLIESLLSVDNAAVLATLVGALPANQRGKALRYGILGAYIFRGFALLFVTILVRIWWLKPVGGLYLLYLFIDYVYQRISPSKTTKKHHKEVGWMAPVERLVGKFWASVLLIELMDIAFSMDNVFAAVAFTPNIVLVCTGVFIGIFAMRFIAQWFVNLMELFPFLETSAYIVIGLLGLKLSSSVAVHFYPEGSFAKFLDSITTDVLMSVCTLLVFFLPIVTSLLFSFPVSKRNRKETEE
jgi:YkoY family integral membrane protein